MPEPLKCQLYSAIAELKGELWSKYKEVHDLRLSLYWRDLKIEELEAAITRMEHKIRELLSETTQDVDAKVEERFRESSRKRAV